MSCHIVQFVKSCGQLAMSILQYFKHTDHVSSNLNALPYPEGPLSLSVPSEAIATANKRVREVFDKSSDGKRGPHLTLMPTQKLLIGWRAAEYGTTSAIRTFTKKYLGLPLKETTVRHLKNLHQDQLRVKHEVPNCRSICWKEKWMPLR